MAVKKKPELAEKPPRELEILHATIEPVIRLAVDGEDPDEDEDLTADLTFYTGASVDRMDYWTGEKYKLAFSMDPAHCDLSRLNGGAPLLNNHSSSDLSDVIGVVESASIQNGIGKASVRFSNRPDPSGNLAGIKADVKNKILRNVSMGVETRKLKDVTPEGGRTKSYLAIDWCPMEISAVPVGADAGAGFLSHQTVEPTIERAETAQKQETHMDEKEVARLAAVEAARVDAIRTETLKAEAVTAERARAASIEAACKPFSQLSADFRAGLISNGATVEAAGSAILNKLAELSQADPTRSANAQITRDQADTIKLGVENAILHRWRPDEFKLEAGREFHGMRLFELAKDSVARSGVNVRGMSPAQYAQLAFQGTTDFPSTSLSAWATTRSRRPSSRSRNAAPSWTSSRCPARRSATFRP
jgi:hypothetical protein